LAKFSLFPCNKVAARYRISPRLGGGVFFHDLYASWAAVMAAFMSSGSDFWNNPISSLRLAGFIFSNVWPLTEGTHSPVIKFAWIFGGVIIGVLPELAAVHSATARAEF